MGRPPSRHPADRDGIEAGPEPLHEVARRLLGQPARVPIGVGDATVDRGGELEGDERPGRVPHLMEEARVLRLGLVREQPELDLEAAGAKPLGAAGRHRIGVRDRRDDPPYPGGENGVGARRLVPLVVQGSRVHTIVAPRARAPAAASAAGSA